MKIFMNHRFFKVVRALSIFVLMSGCAASEMAHYDTSSEMELRGADAYTNAFSCSDTIGGCFHGGMQCSELDLQDSDENISAICLDANFAHSISGIKSHAICFERENMAGEPCQVCQTQAGQTVYDDCMVDAEMRADTCEQDVEQLRDGMMYLCEICKDEDGTLYFGGLEGLNWFRPEQLETNPFKPKTVITNVKCSFYIYSTI